MKKIITILVLAFVFTTTTQAQKKDRKEGHEPMKVEHGVKRPPSVFLNLVTKTDES